MNTVEDKRAEHAAYMKDWCRRNPEKKKANDAKSHARHRESRLAKQKEYSESHKDEQAARSHAFYELHREEMIERAAKHQRLPESQERKRKWINERAKKDLGFRLSRILRSRVWWALRRKSVKSDRTLSLIGCSMDQLCGHLEIQFAPGMSWENYGEWHIDHRKPCAKFDLTDPAQQRQCFGYKNLQPLWALDNLSKGAR